jgi:hypothetical protein
LLSAAQGAPDEGDGEQDGGVGGAGLGEQPVTGSGGTVRFPGQDGDAVCTAVPVVAGAGEQGACGLSASLGQRGSGVSEFGVVQGGVEEPSRTLAVE